jgi:dipeptidyl aminopeptidase/acylaminoacyl peptidase
VRPTAHECSTPQPSGFAVGSINYRLSGDADTTIALEQSARFHAALPQAGASSEFITLPGVAHQSVIVSQKERSRILALFERHLKNKP